MIFAVILLIMQAGIVVGNVAYWTYTYKYQLCNDNIRLSTSQKLLLSGTFVIIADICYIILVPPIADRLTLPNNALTSVILMIAICYLIAILGAYYVYTLLDIGTYNDFFIGINTNVNLANIMITAPITALALINASMQALLVINLMKTLLGQGPIILT